MADEETVQSEYTGKLEEQIRTRLRATTPVDPEHYTNTICDYMEDVVGMELGDRDVIEAGVEALFNNVSFLNELISYLTDEVGILPENLDTVLTEIKSHIRDDEFEYDDQLVTYLIGLGIPSDDIDYVIQIILLYFSVKDNTGNTEEIIEKVTSYTVSLITSWVGNAQRPISYQSARIYYNGKDHKDVYYNGQWHKAIWIHRKKWNCNGYEWMKLHSPTVTDDYDIWLQSDYINSSRVEEYLMRCEWTGEEIFHLDDYADGWQSLFSNFNAANMDMFKKSSLDRALLMTEQSDVGGIGYYLVQDSQGYYKNWSLADRTNTHYTNIQGPSGSGIRDQMRACVYSSTTKDIYVPNEPSIDLNNKYRWCVYAGTVSQYNRTPNPSYSHEVTVHDDENIPGYNDNTFPICQNGDYGVFLWDGYVFSTNGTSTKALYCGQDPDLTFQQYPNRSGTIIAELSGDFPGVLKNRIIEMETHYKPSDILSGFSRYTSIFNTDTRSERIGLAPESFINNPNQTFNYSIDRTNVYLDPVGDIKPFQHNGQAYIYGHICYCYYSYFQDCLEAKNNVVEALRSRWINILTSVDSYRLNNSNYEGYVCVIINVPVLFCYGEHGIDDVFDYIRQLSIKNMLSVATFTGERQTGDSGTYKYYAGTQCKFVSKNGSIYGYYAPFESDLAYVANNEDGSSTYTNDFRTFAQQQSVTYCFDIPFNTMEINNVTPHSWNSTVLIPNIENNEKNIRMTFNGRTPFLRYNLYNDNNHLYGTDAINWNTEDIYIDIKFSWLVPIKSAGLVSNNRSIDPSHKWWVFGQKQSAYFAIRSYNSNSVRNLCNNTAYMRFSSPISFAGGKCWQCSNNSHVKNTNNGSGVVTT